MEQIETQASDLRYLAQAPVALSDTASVTYDTPRPGPTRPGPRASSPASVGHGDGSAQQQPSRASLSGTGKRRSVDDGAGQKQTRSKRNRYISIACNECKRRKIKCNGETPCQRCGNLNLACLYAPNCCAGSFKDSDEFKSVTAQLSRLQDEVRCLNQTIRNMQAGSTRFAAPSAEAMADEMAPYAAAPSPSPPPRRSASMAHRGMPTHPLGGRFREPTDLVFGLDLAGDTMAAMGYQEMEEADADGRVGLHVPPGARGCDPLLEFDKDEMIRLCRLHQDEIAFMYPVVDIRAVMAHANNMAPYLESVQGQQQQQQQQQSEPMTDEKTLLLKMVMCCALAAESHGHSERAARLFDSVEAVVNRKLMSDASHVNNLPLLCLLAGYRFLCNEEILSWRVIGQVMRLCLELGLHRQGGFVKIRNEAERKNALNSFWSAYVLDRRWAFATGLPVAVQDDEIDPNLPLPDDYPFLVAMITHSRIGAKVWRRVSHRGPVQAREPMHDDIDKLDGEILHWYEMVPDEVKIRDGDREKQMTSTSLYTMQRLRIWTYLGLNQIRIWLYTPFLHSAASIMQHPVQAQRVVDLAKDTIQYLDHLNKTASLHRRTQVFFNQFLASAIAAMFLASVHAPVRFSAACRDEFYTALDLVKCLSAKSWVSKRLWSMIQSLKDLAPRFGLDPDGDDDGDDDDDAHSNAALGMMGLARAGGGSLAQPPFYARAAVSQGESHPAPADQSVSENGRRIRSELSRIFERYVGLNGFQIGDDDLARPQTRPGVPSESPPGTYTPEGMVFCHFRDLF